MCVFEVWMEGYLANGNESGAQFLGYVLGDENDTFITAVIKDVKFVNKHGIVKNSTGELRVWGCKLFPDRHEASISFGKPDRQEMNKYYNTPHPLI